MCVCVCVCEREREREREESDEGGKGGSANAVRQHAAPTAAAEWRNSTRAVIRHFRPSTGNGRCGYWVLRIGGVGQPEKKFFVRFFKKSGKSFLKKRKVKK